MFLTSLPSGLIQKINNVAAAKTKTGMYSTSHNNNEIKKNYRI